MNQASFYCWTCNAKFDYVSDSRGNFKKWVQCTCGAKYPSKGHEETLGYTPGETKKRKR